MDQENFQLLLDAVVNAKDIQTQLNNMDKLSVEIKKANLSDDAIKQLQEQLKNNGVAIPLSIDSTQTQKAGQNAAKSYTQGFKSIIQKSNFQTDFLFSEQDRNKVAQKAKDYFSRISDGVVTVEERMSELDEKSKLSGFTINIKNAEGAIESLKYSLRGIFDEDGNRVGDKFQYISGSINDAGVVKQVEAIETKIISAKQNLEKFNTTTANAFKGTDAYNNVVKSIQDLENGVGSIREVDNAMSQLKIHADGVSQALTAGKSLNKFANAKNDIANMSDTIRKIETDFKKLNTQPTELQDKIKQLTKDNKAFSKLEEGTVEWGNAFANIKNNVISIQSEIQLLQKQSSSIPTVFKTQDLDKKGIAYMQKAYNTIEKQMVEIQRLANNNKWDIVDVKGIESASGTIQSFALTVKDAEGTLKKLNFERNKLQGSGKAQSGFMQVGDVQVLKTAVIQEQELENITQKTNQKLAEQRAKLAESVSLKIDNGDYESKVDAIISKTRQWVDENNQARISTTSLTNSLEALNRADAEYANNPTVENQQKLIESSRTLDNAYKKVQNSVKSMNAEFAKTGQIDNLRNKIQEFYDKNSAAHGKWGTQLKQYVAELSSGAEISKERLHQIEQELENIEGAARRAGKLGKSFLDTIKDGAKSFTYWTSSTYIVMKTVNSLREAATELKNINSIITEISKTNDTLDKKGLKDLAASSFDKASKYGRTASDYLTSVQEMSRSGFYGQQGEDMAKVSLLAQAAGDMSEDVADAYLLATNAAYKYEGQAEKLNAVLDSQNYITNHNSVNMTDMAEATTQAGSMAATTGVKIDELSALIGTAVARTKKSGNEIGTALKSLFINLQNTTNKKIVKTFDSLDISMTKMANGSEVLKTPIELIKELSKAYNELPEGSKLRANILQNIGTKYHANTFASILDEGGQADYEKMLEEYANGAGSATEEADKSAKNWEGSLNALNNTWTKLVNNLANSDEIINIIQLFTKALNVVDSFTSKVGLLGTGTFAAGAFASFKNVGTPQMLGVKS